jgi:hypothetical protein
MESGGGEGVVETAGTDVDGAAEAVAFAADALGELDA